MSQAEFGFVLPCRASNIRGQLKHTYLTNKICLKTLPEDLLNSMLFKEQGIPQHQVIRNLIYEFQEVIGTPDKGFSPAQLVDKLTTFRILPSEKRDELKNKIHLKFVKEFNLFARCAQVKTIADEFIYSLDQFLSQGGTNAELSQSAMENVQNSARVLIRELNRLPQGVWLWPKVNNEGIKPTDHAK